MLIWNSVLQCLFLPVTLSVPCPCFLPTPRGQVGRLELQTVWSRKALHWGLLGQGSLWAHGAHLPGEDIQSESRGDVRDVSGSNPSILSSLENLHNPHVSLGESHTFFLQAEDELLRIGFYVIISQYINTSIIILYILNLYSDVSYMSIKQGGWVEEHDFKDKLIIYLPLSRMGTSFFRQLSQCCSHSLSPYQRYGATLQLAAPEPKELARGN